MLGAIYVFCFALGSNWDYRVIFLIPTQWSAAEYSNL